VFVSGHLFSIIRIIEQCSSGILLTK
jgi:hypothetical protein